jgi:hypothetical protein
LLLLFRPKSGPLSASGFLLTARLIGPAAGAVKDAQDFDDLAFDAVGLDVGRARNDQLTRPWPAAWMRSTTRAAALGLSAAT